MPRSTVLDAGPNENLPQKKLQQLLDQAIPTGLRQVDVFAGLNVMIFLFKLHAAAQPEGYPDLPKDTPRPDIWFHPCGELGAEDFDADQLLNSIHYADALGTATFAEVVGPHLACAYLDSTNLSRTNLAYANLDSANLENTILIETNLINTQNLTNEHLAGDTPPLICNVLTPAGLTIDPNRDWDRLAAVLHERFPEGFETLEKAEAWVEERRPR